MRRPGRCVAAFVCLVAGASGVMTPAVAARAPAREPALSAVPHLASSTVAPGAPGRQGADTSDRSKPRPRTVRRSYGQGPVRTVPGRAYTVVFHGRAGDRVRLAPFDGTTHGWLSARQVRLTGPHGKRLVVGPSGFARLMRTGTHRLTFTATTAQAQLVRQLLVTGAPGRTVARPARRGHQYAVEVRVPRTGARRVEVGEFERALFRGRLLGEPDDIRLGEDVLLLPGHPLLYDRLVWGRGPAHAAQRLRLLKEAGQGVRVASANLTALAPHVDGASVPLPATGPGAVLRLGGATADTLPGRLVDVRRPALGWEVVAVGPDDFAAAGSGTGLVQAAPGGETAVLLLPWWDRGRDSRVGLASLVLHGATLQRDGARVGVPLSPDGRRVLVPVAPEGTGSRDARVVVDSAPAGAWRVDAGVLVATPYPRGCNGCGETDRASLEQVGTSGHFRSAGRTSWVLVSPLAGQRSGELVVGVVQDPG